MVGIPGHNVLRRLHPAPSVPGPELPPRESSGRRRLIRCVAVLALATTVGYLAWRIGFTLNPEAWWLSIPVVLLEIGALVSLALFTFSLWTVDALEPPRPTVFTGRKLAVLIPTYNESVEVLLPTVAAGVPCSTIVCSPSKKKRGASIACCTSMP